MNGEDWEFDPNDETDVPEGQREEEKNEEGPEEMIIQEKKPDNKQKKQEDDYQQRRLYMQDPQPQADPADEYPDINMNKLRLRNDRINWSTKRRKVDQQEEQQQQDYIQIQVQDDQQEQNQQFKDKKKNRKKRQEQIIQERKEFVIEEEQQVGYNTFDGYYRTGDRVIPQYGNPKFAPKLPHSMLQTDHIPQMQRAATRLGVQGEMRDINPLARARALEYGELPLGQEEIAFIFQFVTGKRMQGNNILDELGAVSQYNEIIQFAALMIVTSNNYFSTAFSGNKLISEEQFQYLCQANRSLDYDLQKDLPASVILTPDSTLIEEMLDLKDYLDDDIYNERIYRQLAHFLFQETMASSDIYQKIISQSDVKNAPQPGTRNPAVIQYQNEIRWNQEFILPDQSQYIYEDIANRLNVSKMQILRTFRFITQLMTYLASLESAIANSFRRSLRWLFHPKSLKDVSKPFVDQAANVFIKPLLGSICHHLIQVSLIIETASRAMYDSRMNDSSFAFRRHINANVNIDQEDWVDIGDVEDKNDFEEKRVQQVQRVKHRKTIQKIKSTKQSKKDKQENKKWLKSQKGIKAQAKKRKQDKLQANLVQSGFAFVEHIAVAAEHQRLIRTKGVLNSAGLTAPHMGLLVHQDFNGTLKVRRDFVNAFLGVQRNTSVVARMLLLLKNRSFSMKLPAKQTHHYIKMTISGYYRPDERADGEDLRRFTTINFRFSDAESLHTKSFETIAETIADQVYDKVIFIIAQHLEYYIESEDMDAAKLDFYSLAIENFSITSIQEGFALNNNVIKLNNGEFKYHIFNEQANQGLGGIVAYFKGDIVKDPQYIQSLCPDYEDSDNFQCSMNVASYIWCSYNNRKHDYQAKIDFFFSHEYIYLEKFIMLGLVNEVFRYFKEKKKISLALFFPQTMLLYKSETNDITTIWIYVKLGHCWIGNPGYVYDSAAVIDKKKLRDKGDLDPRVSLFEKKKAEQVKVYQLPDSKSRGKDEEITFVFYDIETLQNIKKAKQLQKPFLLCYKTIQLTKHNCIKEKGFFYMDAVCDRFIDYLDELAVRIQQQKEQVKIKNKLVNKPKSKIYVYAHNGGRFDHLFLHDSIMRKHSKAYKFLGTATNIKWSSYGDITFRDSMMLLTGGLNKLCKEFGVAGKSDFDAKNITLDQLIDNRNGYVFKVIAYCQQDVECLSSLLSAFKEKFGEIINGFTFSDIKQTLPSTALHVYQHFFMKKGVKIYGNMLSSLNGVQAQNYERQSYRGGHCQVFRHGTASDLTYLDFVSMYVSIMIQGIFPLSQGVCDVFQGKIYTSALYIVSQFRFKDDTKITNIPLRDSQTKITVYPLQFTSGDAGQQYVCLWGKEMLLAIELGLEVNSLKIIFEVTYANWGNEFIEYMGSFFNLKRKSKDNEKATKKIAKLFGNSLYGKWGQKNEVQRTLINAGEADILGRRGLDEMLKPPECFCRLQQAANANQEVIKSIQKLSPAILQVISEDPSSEFRTPGSLVRLASYITMIGRCRIIKLISEIGFENIYYCDTDSVVFKKDPNRKLSVKIGDDVGEISDQLPGCRVQEADFVAAKCYYLKLDQDPQYKSYEGEYEYVRFKGVSKPSIQMIKNLRAGGTIQHTQEQFKRQWNGVGVEDVTKKIMLGTKRFVNPDGSTRPYTDWNEYLLFFDKILKYESNTFIYI